MNAKNSVQNYKEPLVSIGAVVVRPSPHRPLKRSWVIFFGLPEGLTRSARAALVDLACAGARTREGILVASPSDVALPPATAQRAVRELAGAGVILRPKRGQIYINPSVAFGGSVHRQEEAIAKWAELAQEDRSES